MYYTHYNLTNISHWNQILCDSFFHSFRYVIQISVKFKKEICEMSFFNSEYIVLNFDLFLFFALFRKPAWLTK